MNQLQPTKDAKNGSPLGPAFHFVTTWSIDCRIEEAFAALSNLQDYHRWWPAAFLRSTLIGGAAGTLGARTDMLLKGFLPFTIQFRATLDRMTAPTTFGFKAEGMVDGYGLYTLCEKNGAVEITFDWQANAADPMVNRVARSPMGRIFRANHNWVQDQGGKSLILELGRRSGRSDVASPPKPAGLWLAKLFKQPVA